MYLIYLYGLKFTPVNARLASLKAKNILGDPEADDRPMIGTGERSFARTDFPPAPISAHGTPRMNESKTSVKNGRVKIGALEFRTAMFPTCFHFTANHTPLKPESNGLNILSTFIYWVMLRDVFFYVERCCMRPCRVKQPSKSSACLTMRCVRSGTENNVLRERVKRLQHFEKKRNVEKILRQMSLNEIKLFWTCLAPSSQPLLRGDVNGLNIGSRHKANFVH